VDRGCLRRAARAVFKDAHDVDECIHLADLIAQRSRQAGAPDALFQPGDIGVGDLGIDSLHLLQIVARPSTRGSGTSTVLVLISSLVAVTAEVGRLWPVSALKTVVLPNSADRRFRFACQPPSRADTRIFLPGRDVLISGENTLLESSLQAVRTG